jgi:DNA invertase Pin-like site-specific DNA recombinase
MPRSIGYARRSTTHQDTEIQVTELRTAGCQEVFAERVSSRAPLEKRHQLQRCLETLEGGDELVVSKLDRLGRSQVEVINRLSDLQTKGIYVRTMDGLINTKGLGKLAPLVIGLLTGLAEVERSLIQERTKESVDHRRKTGGNLGGRPKTSDKKERLVIRLREEGESYRSIRDQTGISLATIQRILKDETTAEPLNRSKPKTK